MERTTDDHRFDFVRKIDLLIYGPVRPILENGFSDHFVVHKAETRGDLERLTPAIREKIRGVAVTYHTVRADRDSLSQLPKIEMVASFGVGYDHVDAKYAAEHNIIVTNTPDVLTEEVADVAMGLLISTVREFIKADRYVRSGLWQTQNYPLSVGCCATARSASSAWAGSDRRSRAGSMPRWCRWSITPATRPRTSPTSTTPT